MSENMRKENEDIEESSNTEGWFITGAIIGATVAFLNTPKSGKDAVAEGGQNLMDASRDMFERGRKLVEDAAELFDRGRKLVRG